MELCFPVLETNLCPLVTTSQVSNENTKLKKKWQTLCFFSHFLLSLELHDDSEFETDDGEDGNMTFIGVESSYMHRNVQ